MSKRRTLQTVLTAAACGLLVEVITLSDFDGAWADDLLLFEVGTGGSSSTATSIPPPNILFVFGTSATMNNLICEDLSGSSQCTASVLTPSTAPNSATVCKSPALAAATGPDVNGDDVFDTYQPLFNPSDGTTWQGGAYSVFDAKGPNAGDDLYPPDSIYSHVRDAAWTAQQAGTGANTETAIATVINTQCATLTDCAQKSRCVYSLRTQGYFWEPSTATCGSGDPLALCSTTGSGALGDPCVADTDCASGRCNSSVCSECNHNSQCTNQCKNPGQGTVPSCTWSYCDTGDAATSCQSVLPVTSTGTSTSDEPVFLGNFLNFYPPKGVGLVKAFQDSISTMTGDVRMGVSDLSDVDSGSVAYEIHPPCSQTSGTECFDGDPGTVCFNPSNSNLINYLDGLTFTGDAPLAKALDNAGYVYGDTTGVSTQICDYSSQTECSTNNFVVVVTDGVVSADATDASGVPFVAGEFSGIADGDFNANSSMLDEVAEALYDIDHRADIDGLNNVSTYTVSYGPTDPTDSNRCINLLNTTATAGMGRCLPATNVERLRQVLSEIIDEIIQRARGFTAPSVPTTRFSSTASLSNAIFRPSTAFPLWEGHIYGFRICDENLPGTTCECGEGIDICVQGKDGNDVQYNDEGYLSSNTHPYWDAQLCLSGNPDAPSGGSLAPHPSDWGLNVSGCYLSASQRNLYTVVDTDSDGALTSDDTRIPFTAASVDNYTEFATALAAADTATAKEIVNFFRGYDTDDLNGNSITTEDRNLKTMVDGNGDLIDGWWKLGDIFHSTPNVVERPTGRGMGAWANTASYQAFKEQYASRQKVMLVGANDGMLHAFNAGTWDSSLNDGDGGYDEGNGKELWGFVSPEMLPKLKSLCDPTGGGCGYGEHTYLVDGSVMVRDIWIGGASADKEEASNKDKWRTVAVVGHRRGGSTYMALDVTDVTNPQLLWVFPAAGSSQASLMGQSWLDTFPAPASIGPLWAEDAGGNQFDKWVVLLSGGYDNLDSKGNALFVLDAYTGTVIWETTKTSDGSDTDDMSYSFPATPVFYSRMGGAYPYIAGIVAADHGGQIWHIPTTTAVSLASASLTPQLVFRSVSPLVTPDGPSGDGILDYGEYQPRSFFFAPTLAWYRGRIRVIIGTGDRDMLIPHGTLPPTNKTLGAYCTADTDCDAGTCIDNRCAECSANSDCSGGSNTCEATGCVYNYCADSGCNVPVDSAGLDPDINEAICGGPSGSDTYIQRLYSVTLQPCASSSGGSRPCTESDLQEVSLTTDTFADDQDIGWFTKLSAGEKVATSYDIFAGYALYTTFAPTVACGQDSDVCTPDAKGGAYLYARHFVSGRALDWDNDGTISSGEEAVSLGEGVPTAPAVSVGIDGDTATPSIIAGGSDSGLKAKSASGMAVDMVLELMRFPVTKQMHEKLH